MPTAKIIGGKKYKKAGRGYSKKSEAQAYAKKLRKRYKSKTSSFRVVKLKVQLGATPYKVNRYYVYGRR